MVFYDDPSFNYPVLPKIRQHIFEVFEGEPINNLTLMQIKEHLERIVPGSAWRVRSENYGELLLWVQFEKEANITMYMLKWS